MRRTAPLLLAFLLVASSPERPSSAAQDPAPVRFPADVAARNDIVLENRVLVRMRDGVTLYADVYRPVGDGRHPVILSITPYSTERFPTAYDAAVYFAQRGYVYVFQDVRGRHESDGVWEPFFNDEKDGYDTIEWAARQRWSDGRVAMQGGSYLGQNQWRAAQAAPPSLVTIFPMVASTSIYHDWITLNGGWRLSFNFGWGPVRQEGRIMQNPGPHTVEGLRAIHYDQVQRHLPLTTMQNLVGRKAKFYDDWLANPDYNGYWKPLNVEEMFEKISVPVHTLGGWFDIFSQGTLRGYVGMSQKGATEKARRMSHLVIGPWGHGPSQKTGALDFGPTANVDALPLQLRWYDYWLKGIDIGLAAEPPVKLFVMGRNEWVYEREYPLARTSYRPFYFTSGGNANRDRGDGRLTWEKPTGSSAPDRFRYDPDDPVPSLGGNNCCGTPTSAGPQDQRPIEGRQDVLIYTSDVFQDEIEATGPVKVVVYASSDSADTDFVAKLVDVYPDGSSYNMAEGIVRARYRESVSKPSLLTPGQVYRFEIDLVGTSIAFQKGHRLRVHVTSSHFPQFDRHPNTGATFGATDKVKVAQQTVYHDSERPSHILLPVIPPRRR
ncbi:MAG: CocE/NonD family hydrolase [Acidobacteria bacterium]|nr:CocE/NonD family hydrolase [Acidobacteriota bacterium]MCA1651017.1 CocE/NonD family hydrolase [Acidobacteriota bacterium]